MVLCTVFDFLLSKLLLLNMPGKGMTLDKILRLPMTKTFSCTKHLIVLQWSHTFSGKLETEFFAYMFSINAKTATPDSNT